MTVAAPDMTTAALALHHAGISPIPAAVDGTKAPMGAWKKYMTERMPETDLRTWYDGGHPGLGIVCGTISGNLEMLELEGRAVSEGVLAALGELVTAAGLADIWAQVLGGYLESTPSGGLHILYRVTGRPVPGNTKIATRPATPDELAAKPKEKVKTLLETRGEGGFVIVAPSSGTTHPTGLPWKLLAGGPATIATISADDRDTLLALCQTFHQPTHPQPAVRFTQPADDHEFAQGGLSPGDDFEARTDWADILQPAGWTHIWSRGRIRYWRRPGKPRGVSATTGAADDRERLYVFTSSSEFDTETPYTKFGAHALLVHGGDHHAAARALKDGGYGRPAPEQPRPARTPQFAQPTTPAATPEQQPAPAEAIDIVEPDTYSLTDDGNALRLVDHHADTIRYCPERKTWLTWDGHRWRWDNAQLTQEHARHIARGLPTPDKAQQAHRKNSLSASAIGNMLRLAQSDPRIVAPLDDLDKRAFELNTPAGAINLRTGNLLPPDPSALHTRSTTTTADFTTTPHLWLRFLATTFAGDPALTTYVQRLLGVSLVGQVLEQVLPLAVGDGANGKTTLLGVVMRLMGIGDDGYAISAPADLLLATQNAGHPTEIARLSGARLVVTSELDEGQRFAEAKVKMLTGRDLIAARFMRGDFFSFTPTHSLWILGNHQPAVKTGGPAFWRRLRLLPFMHVVPKEERDPHLEDRLVDDEGPAILGWLIQGAADYFRDGLAEPESVLAATDEYEGQQDSISRFVDEMCEIGTPASQGFTTYVSKVRAAYEAWCKLEDAEAKSPKAFTQALQKSYGVLSERTNNARYYRGIRLSEPAADDDAEGGESTWSQPGW